MKNNCVPFIWLDERTYVHTISVEYGFTRARAHRKIDFRILFSSDQLALIVGWKHIKLWTNP